jgi:hypothetical protein
MDGKGGGGNGAGQVLVVEKILPEAFRRTKLEFVQGETDIGAAQEKKS